MTKVTKVTKVFISNIYLITKNEINNNFYDNNAYSIGYLDRSLNINTSSEKTKII